MVIHNNHGDVNLFITMQGYLDYCCLYDIEKIVFVSCNSPEKNRVGGSVKRILIIFLIKNVFYACFMLIGGWEGGKNFGVGISLNKNLL